MTFEEYIEDMLRIMREELANVTASIEQLETTLLFYREYQAEQREEVKTTETRKEAIPAQVVTEAPDEPPLPPQERVDRRKKQFWTPERKANASRLAKEKWANRKKLPPVEERPRAEFKKEVTPALKPVTREWPERPVAIVTVKPDVLKMLKEAEPMRQLVCTGKTYELRGDDDPVPTPVIGDQPAEPQKVRLIKREHLSIVRPIKSAGNGYRPGLLLDLGHDQCRYTIEGKTMCGAETVKDKSWCAKHLPIVYPAARRFVEAAE